MSIFTQNKDPLNYLRRKISGVLGAAAVIEIRGGTSLASPPRRGGATSNRSRDETCRSQSPQASEQ